MLKQKNEALSYLACKWATLMERESVSKVSKKDREVTSKYGGCSDEAFHTKKRQGASWLKKTDCRLYLS